MFCRVDPLLEMLRDGDDDERWAAIEALSRMLVPDVTFALEVALDKETERELKERIREVLGE